MNFPISAHQDNSKSNDDSILINRIDSKSFLVVVCDGVSSADSGRIASHIISKVVFSTVSAKTDLLRSQPNKFTQLLFKTLDKQFKKLHKNISEYSLQSSKTPFPFLFKEGIENVSPEEKDLKNESKEIGDSKWDKIFQEYAKCADVSLEDFKGLISSSDAEKIRFCSTVSFLYIEEMEKGLFKITVFNLGDGYILKTTLTDEKQSWDFKDWAFNRSSDSATPQYDSRNSIVGDYELSLYYTKPNCIISIGSDGSKIKSPEYDGQRQYQYEYFREFSEMLNNNKAGFKNSSEKWYNHIKQKSGIGDDFSLVSILLK